MMSDGERNMKEVESANIDSKPYAVVIRVSDLYKWLEVVVEMETFSRHKIIWRGKELLGPKWLYRGQANSGWEISSTFEREILPLVHKDVQDREFELREIERASMLYFKQWADIPKANAPSTQGEWLALMQHYGVPTRLVDFTESPLQALGFALEDKSQSTNFAIWAVPNSSLRSGFEKNQTLMRAKGAKPIMYDTHAFRVESDDFDRNQLEKILIDITWQIDSAPCLLRYIPIGMNDRQKRQRGVFMATSHLNERFMPLLHIWTMTDIENFQNERLQIDIDDVLIPSFYSRKYRFCEIVNSANLIKYEFDDSLRDNASTLLRCCNITGQTRYGGLERLSKEVQQMMKEGF